MSLSLHQMLQDVMRACLQVLLVGGATRMPGVRQLVKNMTGLDAREFLVDPDEVNPTGDLAGCVLAGFAACM